MDLSVDGFSLKGNERQENQDSILWNDQIFTIADGMGGKSQAREAASLATELSIKFCKEAMVSSSLDLAKVFIQVNDEMIASIPGAGTTLAIVAIQDTSIHMAHVGDSRIYLSHRSKWKQCGSDQNLAAETGLSINAQMLTNFVGSPEFEPPKPRLYSAEDCDHILLCTDGMYSAIDVRTLVPHASKPLAELCLSACNQCPEDDCSAILVSFNLIS